MGVTYLLDTHVFLWLLGDPGRVPHGARNDLADPDNRLLVSSVSATEVATKNRLGKLPGVGDLLFGWEQRVASLRAEELALSSRHALLAGSLPWPHRDPFDRLLVAQSVVEDAVLVTADRAVQRSATRILAL